MPVWCLILNELFSIILIWYGSEFGLMGGLTTTIWFGMFHLGSFFLSSSTSAGTGTVAALRFPELLFQRIFHLWKNSKKILLKIDSDIHPQFWYFGWKNQNIWFIRQLASFKNMTKRNDKLLSHYWFGIFV